MDITCIVVVVIIVVVVFVGTLIAEATGGKCKDGKRHAWKMTRFAVWGSLDWRNYEANWECEKCGLGKHRFGIEESEAMHWFPDWKKARESFHYSILTEPYLDDEDIARLRGEKIEYAALPRDEEETKGG